ncbi:cytochrome b5, seed isoform [Heracleum sosnowskyi]|uniref:Cytochrome b5, seed isoform n=1 Tax=Heracleum sosnowskyi TaxID=360622 RepID=A0AAD8MQG1_9APIA|nr:cytochrome b5, seed isoform [Heracleum sosnowskyi]
MGITDNKILSFADVSVHDNPKDCWVIINAKAYDVTKFLDDHPGGDEVLLQVAGEDASEEFESAGHGSAARLMLDEYYVREIDPLSSPVKKTTTPTPELPVKRNMVTPILPPKTDKGENNFVIKLLLILLVLGMAIALGLYSSN